MPTTSTLVDAPVEVRDLTKRYGTVLAVDHLDRVTKIEARAHLDLAEDDV